MEKDWSLWTPKELPQAGIPGSENEGYFPTANFIGKIRENDSEP